MGDVAERLRLSGLELPKPPAPAGSYVPAVVSGGLVFTAGQLPMVDGALLATGRVGDDVTPEIAAECARVAALNALAAASTVCELDAITRIVRLTVYVCSAGDFHAQPVVANGASDVMALAFGDAGLHAREAVGVAALPLGAPVELSLVAEYR